MYTTRNGKHYEFPLNLLNRVKHNDDVDMYSLYKDLFNELYSAERDIFTLRSENLRLTHENEFMLKLIERSVDDKS